LNGGGTPSQCLGLQSNLGPFYFWNDVTRRIYYSCQVNRDPIAGGAPEGKLDGNFQHGGWTDRYTNQQDCER